MSSYKRLAKNTIYMYFRMIIVTLITLYTSRIVLEALGVQSYGIYNAIAGFIILISFLNSGLTIITQRNLTYEIGLEKGDVCLIFSLSIRVHLAISLILILIAETIGLWFINNVMHFPQNSVFAVNCVYQLAVLSAIVNILKVPYSALIISHERMDYYAKVSIIEAILKVTLAYIILNYTGDRLIMYSILLLLVNLIVFSWQFIFCRRNFTSIRFVKRFDKERLKKILSLSGWTFLSSFASIGCQQGDNIIINIFYGVLYNASVGIASQINTALLQLVSGFQQALNPQLVKNEASGEKSEKENLIRLSSKFSFCILFTFSIPVLININPILSFWLTDVPPQTAILCYLIVCGALIEAISGPLWMAIYATGNIRNYQIVISVLFILELPFAYLVGYNGFPFYYIFIIRLFQYIVLLLARLLFLKKLINLHLSQYIKSVVLPISSIVLLTGSLIFFYNSLNINCHSLITLAINIIIWIMICATISFSVGLSKTQRYSIMHKLKSAISSAIK